MPLNTPALDAINARAAADASYARMRRNHRAHRLNGPKTLAVVLGSPTAALI